MNQPELMRHLWLMFVAVTVANAFFLKSRSAQQIASHPELADGYRRLFQGVLLWGNLPWLVMGAEIELRAVPNVFSYFRPRDGNPFVLSWFGVVIAIWILGFYWLFTRRGAEFLIKHPGLFRTDPSSPTMIRVLYCISVAGGVVALIAMFSSPDFAN